MRLWNLMTAKKAGVLQFERELLAQVGEGKWGTGEGRRVVWNENGESFVVGFERGVVVFGIDSKPKAVLRPVPERTKVQQMRFLPKTGELAERDVLAVSTEDGKVLFYDSTVLDEQADSQSLPQLPCIAKLGGEAAGITNRVKDFEILQLPPTAPDANLQLLVVTANSDGAIRLWTMSINELVQLQRPVSALSNGSNAAKDEVKQVGRLIGMVDSGNRITCLGAFVMSESKASKTGVQKDNEEIEDVVEGDEDTEEDEEEFKGLD